MVNSFRLLSLSVAAMTVTALLPQPTLAAGPVERLLEVLVHPNNQDFVTVRYGGASEGFLISEDGGRSFRAVCTAAMSTDLKKISRQGALYSSVAAMDGDGKLIVAADSLWTDDATRACSWREEPSSDGQWIDGAPRLDPKDANQVFALRTTSQGMGDSIEAWTELMRRDASGTWSVVAKLRPHVAQQRAYGSNLLLAATPAGTRMYATVNTARGSLEAVATTTVIASDDGGNTWADSGTLAAALEGISFIATDPTNADVILAVEALLDEPDTLFLSKDRGRSFAKYATIQEYSGVTFDPAGRVFIGDAGDGLRPDNVGGVWTGARLGEPLTNIIQPRENESPNVDAIRYDARSGKLFAAKIAYFGLIDPSTGVFDKLTEIEAVQGLVECPGKDLMQVCEAQLNEGAAWCCTGHYPFTEFCGGYNVTSRNGRRVFCGQAGRVADIEAGRRPSARLDGGTQDAGVSDAEVVRPAMDAGQSNGARDAARASQSDATRAADKQDASATQKPRGGGGEDGCSLGSRPRSRWNFDLLLASVALLLRAWATRTRRRSAELRRERPSFTNGGM